MNVTQTIVPTPVEFDISHTTQGAFMRTTLLWMVIGLSTFGCEDPGAKVTSATVESPVQQEADRAVTAETAKALASLAISPSNSEVEFVGAKVTASHPGGFTDFAGTVDLGDSIENSEFAVTIQTASLYADKEKLTKHLKSPDFFDVARFPTVTFRSAEITRSGDGYAVAGDLTLHGVTKRISFPANIQVSDTEVDASAEFSINRHDFGISYPGMRDDLIRDLVVIKLSLELPRGG
jgi:polyisoprenoid-binding protein YceI